LGLTDDPKCQRCLEEDESATHILRDCETVAHLRFRHPGQFFMEPCDFYDVCEQKEQRAYELRHWALLIQEMERKVVPVLN
jgi:hypothetical protein